ncbi:phasin family protein [Pseudovibrio exalbescens]|uniref:Phasin family protein n=1 Tax=Pseudovibrio exalbescens TaxID=197461 RepID=A0A1U7JCD6_9HYPH|nr:TIGR01841 family phasin [Pseudovibrio exalbescens]OKL42354.1 phasin family protein [Pseudovibrio exalbescens]
MSETTTATSKTAAKTRTAKASASKTAEKEVPSMSTVEMPAVFREMTEKSVDSAREAYAKFKDASEEATGRMEETLEATRDGLSEMNIKAIDAAQENTNAMFAHMKDMFGAKTLSEAIELQSTFARKQYEAMTSQAKDIQETAAKLTNSMSEPAKAAFEKAMKESKVL